MAAPHTRSRYSGSSVNSATRPSPLLSLHLPACEVVPLGELQGEEQERDALLAWVGENLSLARRSAFGQRILYWTLGVSFVLGLAAHGGGFLLKSSATTEPVLLVADLL